MDKDDQFEQDIKSKRIVVENMDERNRADSVTAFNRLAGNMGGFNETSKPFPSPGNSPAILA